jgi:hypothetical protein
MEITTIGIDLVDQPENRTTSNRIPGKGRFLNTLLAVQQCGEIRRRSRFGLRPQ